ncbi:hypothetical protein MUN82_03875 [Hymenobacter aerilatus]|uniref:Phage portal protein n=1 Tax=Hymenobacter aerilatus TaxID=2932251 RepID=A0A8T9SWX4_9BACT|nr:hypothetical protein [Hymenobacter aerilatus]UOR06237.1 hypothetical protein MUN82_03875 [Hymenobacter aerilatus]
MFNSQVDFRRWGDDNRYPQRLIEAVAGSGTASVCVDTKAKFIEGNGFNDNDFYEAECNDQGQTVDELLSLATQDVAQLEGYALLININANGYPAEVLHAPFEKWRPDKEEPLRYTYLLNQVFDPSEGKRYRKADAVKHPVFNPREKPEERLARANAWKDKEGNPVGLEGYPGEVYYWWRKRPGAHHHPRPVYDSVLEDVYAEARLKVSRHGDIAEGFKAQVMITEFGSADPSQEVLDANAVKYGTMVGENASRILLQYAAEQTTKPQVDALPAPDASKRYATDEEAIKVNIREVFQLPSAVIGREVAGKLGTSDDFGNAVKYVQRMVINREQRALERGFRAVFELFQPAGGQPGALNATKDFSIQNLTLEQAASLTTGTNNTGNGSAPTPS